MGYFYYLLCLKAFFFFNVSSIWSLWYSLIMVDFFKVTLILDRDQVVTSVCDSTYADRHWILPNTFSAYSHFSSEEREVTCCHKAGSLGKAHNCSILSILTLKKIPSLFNSLFSFHEWFPESFFLYSSRPSSNINSYHLLNFYSVLITLPQGLHLTTLGDRYGYHVHVKNVTGNKQNQNLSQIPLPLRTTEARSYPAVNSLPAYFFLQIWELLLA